MRSYGLETQSHIRCGINYVKFDGQISEAIKDGAHTAPSLEFLGMTLTTLVGCRTILHYVYLWIGVGPSCLVGLHNQLRGACQDVLFMCDFATI